jgi:hypothetical protein
MKLPTVTITIESELSKKPLVGLFPQREYAICGGQDKLKTINR